jgi:hypothetical protein
MIEIRARLMKPMMHCSRLTSSCLDTSTLDSAANVEIAINAVPTQYAKLKSENCNLETAV